MRVFLFLWMLPLLGLSQSFNPKKKQYDMYALRAYHTFFSTKIMQGTRYYPTSILPQLIGNNEEAQLSYRIYKRTRQKYKWIAIPSFLLFPYNLLLLRPMGVMNYNKLQQTVMWHNRTFMGANQDKIICLQKNASGRFCYYREGKKYPLSSLKNEFQDSQQGRLWYFMYQEQVKKNNIQTAISLVATLGGVFLFQRGVQTGSSQMAGIGFISYTGGLLYLIFGVEKNRKLRDNLLDMAIWQRNRDLITDDESQKN